MEGDKINTSLDGKCLMEGDKVNRMLDGNRLMLRDKINNVTILHSIDFVSWH
jgi:hypothetical protein